MEREMWPAQVAAMPHLRKRLPNPDTGLSHFYMDGGFVHELLFNYLDPGHLPFSLGRCLEWVEPNNWIHRESGTLEGGPYGCKWAVLLLVHLRINVVAITSGHLPPYHSADMPAEFVPRDLAQLNASIAHLSRALEEATEHLQGSLPERTGLVDQHALADDSQWTLPNVEDTYTMRAPVLPDEWEVGACTKTYFYFN
jgi:hypothetical protein